MAGAGKDDTRATMIKVVDFDEESASDYLDMVAGGKTASTSEDVKERTKEMHGKVEAGLIAKLSWLPFLGASGELSAGAGASAAGKSILSKTLSNTILTDYLAKADNDPRVVQLRDLRVTAPKDSMAYMKMFTPYMVLLKLDDVPFDSLTPYIAISSRRVAPLANKRRASYFCSSLRAARFALALRSNPA